MLQVNGLNVSLDRKEKDADVDFISHAHSDHISSAKSSKSVLASEETVMLLEAINGITVQRAHLPVGVKLVDAGHILGSKQLTVEDGDKGVKTVYTGDFQLQRSKACNPLQAEDADVLIVDSTYCSPDIRFEERGDVEAAMQAWTESKLQRGIVLFGVYALGKAQEVIAILNERNILPIVSKRISAINKVYEKSGVKLDYTSAYEGNSEYESLLRGNFAVVVENSMMRTMAAAMGELYNKKVHTAVATGWAAAGQFSTDVQFTLSDHADFSQCTDYINMTGAKKVVTYGSNRLELAHNLVNAGYDAMPF